MTLEPKTLKGKSSSTSLPNTCTSAKSFGLVVGTFNVIMAVGLSRYYKKREDVFRTNVFSGDMNTVL